MEEASKQGDGRGCSLAANMEEQSEKLDTSPKLALVRPHLIERCSFVGLKSIHFSFELASYI